MRLMMFNAMELRSNLVRRDVKGLRQGFRNADESSQHFARSRAKLGIFNAYMSFVPRRAQGLRGMATWSTSKE